MRDRSPTCLSYFSGAPQAKRPCFSKLGVRYCFFCPFNEYSTGGFLGLAGDAASSGPKAQDVQEDLGAAAPQCPKQSKGRPSKEEPIFDLDLWVKQNRDGQLLMLKGRKRPARCLACSKTLLLQRNSPKLIYKHEAVCRQLQRTQTAKEPSQSESACAGVALAS